MSATQFKAQCLAVIEHVHRSGEPVIITKRGRAMARLVPDAEGDDRPWMRLRQSAVQWVGDPFAPAVPARDVKALK